MSAARRTARDERRRRLGQNFLLPDAAARFVAGLDVVPGEVCVDLGAGAGAITRRLLATGARVVAVEVDPDWVSKLRRLGGGAGGGRLEVVHADARTWPFPRRPFRVVACLPFGATTAILHRLLDDPVTPLVGADLIVQWDVARKRASSPPSTLVSTAWAPWWEFRLGPRVPAGQFRPVPGVDGGVLRVTRRTPPLLPVSMAAPYAEFVRARWPFP